MSAPGDAEFPLQPVSFSGAHGALVPLALAHERELSLAAEEGELWKLWYTAVPSPERMREEIERRLSLMEAGTMLPFTILDAQDKPVGMTSYMNIEHQVPRLEIGYTWYGRRVQRTALNTECKVHLLTHAFDTIGCIAVEFRTAFFNRQSRRAIERLGARLDGILRNHRRYPDGSLRDTCVYSITEHEWPAVRTHLRYMLTGGTASTAGKTADESE